MFVFKTSGNRRRCVGISDETAGSLLILVHCAEVVGEGVRASVLVALASSSLGSMIFPAGTADAAAASCFERRRHAAVETQQNDPVVAGSAGSKSKLIVRTTIRPSIVVGPDP